MRSPVLLLHPPVVKPCEPPAGIARLAGALHHHGIPYSVADLNIEALLALSDHFVIPADRWTLRAARNISKNLDQIRNPAIVQNFDRYQRTVTDLNRFFEKSLPSGAIRLSLANYQHQELSPVRSRDLLRAAEAPEANPFSPYFQERLNGIIEAEGTAIVGLSLNYLSQALCSFAILGFLRREHPRIRLVLGGCLITSWMRRPNWQNPFRGLVDHLVAGPGEQALLSLVGIDAPNPACSIPNYDFTSHRPRDPAPGTQHPALSTQDRSYLSPGFILPYSSSSGCYWNQCAFCPERAEGNPYLPIPVGRVIEELQVLVTRTNPALLHLLDNAISPHLLNVLAHNPPGAPWYGFARVTEHLAEEDFCIALRRSGCVMLQLGIESGDQQVLDEEHKGIDLDVVSRALRSLRKAGIGTYVYLLFGTPHETLREARNTLDFTVRHAEQIGFLNLSIFNLPIYGDEAKALEIRMHYDGDLSLYADFHHPKGWHRGVVRQFLDKEFKREPAIAAIIRRDPAIFSSNHAPFFADVD
jgi:radical SAM superfamily enzyme YgiQ (UPF0313 family)